MTEAFALKSQILDLERSFATLPREEDLVQERLDSCTYPVLSLPNEIVALIFVHFLPPYPKPPPFRGLLSPTVLTQICCQWREIALACPDLWRAISLPEASGDGNGLGALEMAEQWLNRSGCGPLSFEIVGLWSQSPEMLAIQYRARWEHVTLRSRHRPLPLDILERLGDLHGPCTLERPMPLLRHLGFSTDGTDNLYPADVPLLRSVVIHVGSRRFARMVLPCSQLTSLAIEKISVLECAPILQQVSNLTFCSLGVCSNLAVNGDLPNIYLPLLEGLYISDPWRRPMTGFLDTLVTPRLLLLQIPEGFLGTDSFPWNKEKRKEALQSFITKSGCTLRLLRIVVSELLGKDVKVYKSACPSAKVELRLRTKKSSRS
ncbi:hypothetical protein FB45DRAFT_905562 [Roridomyces roridus]|uniref:F-box domain-containing protein n=1 Tax=Roridomyces roridus TaxID=1738132 RepID=A0AAD7FVL4_9AGAR|nr:hypothetical protein FB45DRAFT_905562 [Roridomyces roridus]